ncbi:hypothetical protein [Nonomuraea sp. NPDC050643]|uniref:hypothetical protein n=1 Tax=Nonomuraea sp. NPDC050643 TaxID=3155660 RepID=UPI00340CFFFD
MLAVVGDGMGIAPEHREIVFEGFARCGFAGLGSLSRHRRCCATGSRAAGALQATPVLLTSRIALKTSGSSIEAG